MKRTSPTRRASSLAGAGFHPHFTWEFIWRACSIKRAEHLDVNQRQLKLAFVMDLNN